MQENETILEKIQKLEKDPNIASQLLKKQASEILMLKKELADYKELSGQLYQIFGTIAFTYPDDHPLNDKLVEILDMLSESFADDVFELDNRTLLPFNLNEEK